MPRSSSMVSYTCECGTTFNSPIYQTVNVTLEPPLMYRLLAGLLNVAVCPNCGRKTESALPFVYHDMRRGLFAYVHPNAEASEEQRDALLDRLREVYDDAVAESERILADQRRRAGRGRADTRQPQQRRRTPGEDLAAQLEPEAPPMQVIFGMEDLMTLVDSLLEPEERLGRVALSARGVTGEARARVIAIAERLAEQFDLQVATEGEGRNFTVWLYGPRNRISTLSAQLSQA